VDGILDTENVLSERAGMQYHVDLHATVNSNITVKEGHDLAHKLKDT
jgi:divalent metal cation (Fe/Co/Zn/Cd) transporter